MTGALRAHQVLLVEDSPTDVLLLETSIELGQLPLQLRLAEDGMEALQQLEQDLTEGNLPELILLDLNMPRMNGFEVLEALKEREDYQSLRVVVLTTSAASVDRERALELGAHAFVTKPFEFDRVIMLLGRVTSALNGQLEWHSV